MRANPAIVADTGPVRRRELRSRPEALKISLRAHQLCSAARLLADKTEQLVHASRRLQQNCKELLRDAEMLTARVNSHGRQARFAEEQPQKR